MVESRDMPTAVFVIFAAGQFADLERRTDLVGVQNVVVWVDVVLIQCLLSDIARISTTCESPTPNAYCKNNISDVGVIICEVTTFPAQRVHFDEYDGPATKNSEAVDELLGMGAGNFVTSFFRHGRK